MRRVASYQRRFVTAFLGSTTSVVESQSQCLPQTPGFLQSNKHQVFRNFSSIVYPTAQVFVGKQAPAFSAPAVIDGELSSVSLEQYKGKYVVLFFYPKDFTFVCPTEIIAFSDRAKEFEALGCQLIAASTDTEESHLAWIKTPRKRGGLGFMQIPILADTTKEIASKYGVLIQEGPAEGIALRGLFIINPEGVVEQITVNSLPVGRSVDEALRLLQAIQFVKEHGEVCPADWKPGQDTMIADPEKSMDYFNKQSEVPGEEEEFGAKLKSMKSGKEYKDIVSSGKKVVVEFMAPWCGKCRMLSPHLEALQDKHSGVEFYKVDTTEEQLEGLSTELGVKALPVLKFFKGGSQAMPDIIGYKKQPMIDAVEKLAAM
eukprot:TRINITY_DN765_c1_g1_i3.p1 TRINITY_DN765_c1_g1~~TRINITY_DN765_c1_g1_i3.p1  ORF type:complete len:373 (-),score=83.07 TRINITY_DN765_c1_g1_i3:268-1386(-)